MLHRKAPLEAGHAVHVPTSLEIRDQVRCSYQHLRALHSHAHGQPGILVSADCIACDCCELARRCCEDL